MRISDWSSDVCASDLAAPSSRTGRDRLRRPASGRPSGGVPSPAPADRYWSSLTPPHAVTVLESATRPCAEYVRRGPANPDTRKDRQSVVWGKSVSVRVDLGGRRNIKKKKKS